MLAPYTDFLHGAGLDGMLSRSARQEGILFSVPERKRVTELFLEASAGRLLVAMHCGAQTTADTVALAEHAADAGADAVAVIGPPYFSLDVQAQHDHLLAAARACAPTPFYVYELAAAAGYPFDPEMLWRLRDEADNFRGLKVSDSPWEAFERYLFDGLDIFVGPEALIHRGLSAGAVERRSRRRSRRRLRRWFVSPPSRARQALRSSARIETFPRHAALKRVVGRRGFRSARMCAGRCAGSAVTSARARRLARHAFTYANVSNSS